jgi:Lon protease-like protein
MTSLPAVIPIFPLPNVVLFPGVALPLHIFEPRYRDMVRDTAAAEEPLIGMVLLRGDWRKDYHGCPEIFPIGCAGHMTSVQPLPDGRYNILLHGVREFEIDEELRERSYRRARVRWRPSEHGALTPDGRKRLDELLRRYAGAREPDAVQKVLADETISDDLRVSYFCYALDLAPVEKQALLEAAPLQHRAERLCEILEFALEAAALGPGTERYH